MFEDIARTATVAIAAATGWLARSAPGPTARLTAQPEPGPQVAADLGAAGSRSAAGPPLAMPRPARIFRIDVA